LERSERAARLPELHADDALEVGERDPLELGVDRRASRWDDGDLESLLLAGDRRLENTASVVIPPSTTRSIASSRRISASGVQSKAE
jgi:hypothetical protein